MKELKKEAQAIKNSKKGEEVVTLSSSSSSNGENDSVELVNEG